MLSTSLSSSLGNGLNLSQLLNFNLGANNLSELLGLSGVTQSFTPSNMLGLMQGVNNMNSNNMMAPPVGGQVDVKSLEDFQKQYGEYLQPLPKWANTNFKVPDNLAPIFQKYSQQFGVPYWLAAAVAQQESSFNPNLNAWPNDGAGVMQLMPDEARRYGVTNVLDPDQNIRAGINMLSDLYKQTGRWDLAVAAYNGGLGKVKNGVIGFNTPSRANFNNKAFTINHVWKILNMWGYR